MYQSSKLTRVVIALGISIVLQVLFVVLLGLARSGGHDGLERMVILVGGDFLNGGYIQFLTFVAFFWGLIEVQYFKFWTDFERKYLNVELLPGEEHVVLGIMEVNKIRLQVSDYLKKKKQESAYGSFFLLEIIKKACTKFRSDNSSESAFLIVESQSRINREKTESTQSGIRYLLWAIPSIGFVGTILGISQSLSIAGSGDIDRITSALGVAFDTTLLALVLSLILMYLYHGLQEKNELLHHEIEEFVIENLINKIDVN
jgi:biopolymer transport protein ExbB/TolQ